MSKINTNQIKSKLYENELFGKEGNYWKLNLQSISNKTNLYYTFKINKTYDNIAITLEKEYQEKIFKITKNNNLNLYSLFVSTVAVLLNKYRNTNINIISPLYRELSNKRDNIIFLPIKIDNSEVEFKDLLKQTRNLIIESYNNQNFPFEKILELTNNKNITKITQVACSFNEINEIEILKQLDIPIIFNFTKDIENIVINIEYNFNDKDFVWNLLKQYINILKQLLNKISVKLNDIEIADTNDREKILYKFNDMMTSDKIDKTINELFQEVVERSSNNIAVVYENNKLTYKELDKKSNSLARYLRDNGVNRNTIVGLSVDRSLEIIVGILAIIKAGGAYLPIDPEYPDERKEYMIKNSNAKFLLTQERYLSNLDLGECKKLNIEDRQIYELGNEKLSDINSVNDLIYIIYTSGSTGLPKGIMIEHGNVSNLVNALEKSIYGKYSISLNIALIAPYVFDASVKQIFLSLLKGHTLHIVNNDTRYSGEKLVKFYNDNNIDISDGTPMHLEMICNCECKENISVKEFIIGGDNLSVNLINRFKKKYLKNQLIITNVYGPTECCVDTTAHSIDLKEKIEYEIIPIGSPLANYEVVIVGENNKLLPIGVPGEICVSGKGVSRGYINNKKLTDEKFVPSPFFDGKTMYRTGDLGRWLKNGQVELLGRIDFQVKIRGYRIELGEIEREILKNNDVKEVVVIDRVGNNNDKYLCAYIVSNKKIDINDLKNNMSKRLPTYMIPSHIIQLKKMPLNINGKIDRKLLPEPNFDLLEREYAEPTNKIEKNITKVISEVLGIKKVGINDNFFDLGGDSIKAIQVSSRIRKYGIYLEVKDILSSENIRTMAKYVENYKVNAEQGIVEGIVQLTPIQRQFIRLQNGAFHHYNQSIMLYSNEGFDEWILRQVINKIVEHHDALRIVIREDRDKILSAYNRGIEGTLYEMKIYDYTEFIDYKQRIIDTSNDIQASMDLTNGPIVKLALFKTVDGHHLLITVHHYAIDGVSWRILLEDIFNLYTSIKENKELKLPEKTTSFKEWAEKQVEYSKSNKAIKELKYWKEVSNIKTDSILKNTISSSSKFSDFNNIKFKFNVEDTKKLLKETNRAYNTEINDILIAALGTALKEWADISSVRISIEGHGRERLLNNLDITRTVGWFTSCYPLVLDLSDSKIDKLIKKTKENIRKIPNKGIGYGILKYLIFNNDNELDIKTDISFNYLGQFGNDLNNILFTNSFLPVGNLIGNDFKMENSIDINLLIINDELTVNISYNTLDYRKESIERLVTLYNNNLKNIINHCIEKSAIEYTPSDYGVNDYTVEEVENLEQVVKETIGENITIKKINKLTPMQEGILFTYLQNTKTTAYIVQLEFGIEGELNLDILNKSYNYLLLKHDILRTIIYQGEKHASQIVLEGIEENIDYKDYSALSNKEELYEAYKKEIVETGFDLSKEIPYKFSVVKQHENKYKLLITSHHIILDGWSNPIIIEDLFKAYKTLKNNEEVKFENSYDFSSYIEWINKQDKKAAIDYWREYLYGYKNTISLKTGIVKEKKYNEGLSISIVEENTAKRIKQIANKVGVTLSTICEAIWGIILQKYKNNDDVVFGMVVSGRPSEIEGIEKTVGIFINSIPVRVKTKSNETFIELIKRLQHESNQSKAYEYISLADIQNLTECKQSLINSLMLFENYPVSDSIISEEQSKDLGFRIAGIGGREETNYDLAIVFMEEYGLSFKIMHNKNIYTNQFVEKLSSQINNVFKSIANEEEILINEIEIIDTIERNRILNEFNNTNFQYPTINSIIDLFEAQVKKTPDATALLFDGKELTYKELNDKANSLARALKEKGIGKEQIVAIMMERSFNMIIGIFAIMKAGAAYLPIDYEYPIDRINYILDDSKASIILTQNKFFNKINYNGEIIDIESSVLYQAEKDNLKVTRSDNDLAYVIYTSGTTGMPKGVMVEQKSLINLILTQDKNYQFRNSDVYLFKTMFVFDVSLTEIFGWFGGKLAISKNGEEKDPFKIKDYINNYRITHINFVPSMLSVFLSILGENDVLKNLKYVLAAGEALTQKTASEFYKKLNNSTLVNLYGPTEATIYCNEYVVLKENLSEIKNIPIGKPLNNYRSYIMDKNKKLCPINIVGELFISGIGVARGYLNKESLTLEKFEDDIFQLGEKMYKTGDLARCLPDGNIEFLGRIDHQVKIRGFRIELGEIERALLSNNYIKEAIVVDIDDENGSKYLCGYVVSDKNINESELKKFISEKLPYYMIPTHIIQLDKMPLNVNGKIDRRLFPKSQVSNLDNNYIKPKNKIEEKIVEIYCEVLGIDKISISDNFFEIGGHSLKATKAILRLRKELGLKIEVVDIFNYPIVEDMAYYLINSNDNGFGDIIEKEEEKEYYEVSLAQNGIYERSQLDKNSTSYNMPMILVTDGSFDLEKIQYTLNKIINRHESFRTSFYKHENRLIQKISDNEEITVDTIVSSHSLKEKENIDKLLNSVIKPFDLEKAPLIRAMIIKLRDAELLIIDMHHIVSDGVSSGIFINEFNAIYKGTKLENVKIQYKDFVKWQNNLKNKYKLKNQEEYWLNKLNGELRTPQISMNYPKNQLKIFKGDRLYFTVENTIANKLKELMKNTGVTKHMLMLSAFNILLSKLSGQEDILIGTIIAGRTNISFENTIGMFVNFLIIRNQVDKEKTFKEFLLQVKENEVKSYMNQDYPFDDLREKLKERGNLFENFELNIAFATQNFGQRNIEIDGLKIESYKLDRKLSKVDLALVMEENDEIFSGFIEYNTQLFKEESILELKNNFNSILKIITEKQEIKIKDIKL